eukprot:9484438-Alexandrium_andersonii.AAC.1
MAHAQSNGLHLAQRKMSACTAEGWLQAGSRPAVDRQAAGVWSRGLKTEAASRTRLRTESSARRETGQRRARCSGPVRGRGKGPP